MIRIKHLLLLVLLCSLGSTALAQKGTRISGNVSSDSEGPLFMVSVTERDNSNRVISATQTDMEGNFTMIVKNTSNHLEISYIGYKTQTKKAAAVLNIIKKPLYAFLNQP